MSGNSLDLCLFNCLDLSNLAVWTLSGSFVPWMSGPCPDLRALDVWTCPDPCILVVGTFRT